MILSVNNIILPLLDNEYKLDGDEEYLIRKSNSFALQQGSNYKKLKNFVVFMRNKGFLDIGAK